MPITNPFAAGTAEGDAWQLGFQAGFMHPELTDGPPLQVNLLEAYQEGADGGRQARRAGASDGGSWLGPDALEVALETAGHVLLHVVGDKLAGAAGGLVAVVAMVLEIPGDTVLGPLPETFSVPAEQDNGKYVAVCLRRDHAMVTAGARDDGSWTGPSRDRFEDAASDMTAHGHPEAAVARCSVAENTCGIIWAATAPQ